MSERAAFVRSLLLPMAGYTILLPSAVVAEVIAYSEPLPAPDAPDSVLGILEWRFQNLPVVHIPSSVSVESRRSNRMRLAVLYGLVDNSRLPYYAMLADAIPNAFTALPDIAGTEPTTTEPLPFAGQLVQAGRQQALIPNLEVLENELLQWPGLGSQPRAVTA